MKFKEDVEMHEIINKINNLTLNTSEEEVYESLNELKSAVIQNADVSRSILSNSNIIKSFEAYANADQNTVVVSEIVDISLSNLPLTDPASFAIIEQLIATKCFAPIAVRKLQKDCEEISKSVPKSTVLLLITDCLKSPEVRVGPPTIALLQAFITTDLLDDAEIKRELDMCAEMSHTEIRCRAYELTVGIAVRNRGDFEKTSFILERITSELMANEPADILLQMNLLEILQGLCAHTYGLNFLEEKGILRNLALKITTVNDDPLVSFLIPSLIKFFGNVATAYPQKIFSNYSPLVDLLFESLLNDEDSTLAYTALDTLGNLCKNDDGKKAMDAIFGERVCQVLSHIYQQTISHYPSEIKLRALECLQNVLDTTQPSNNQVASITQKWIEAIFALDCQSLLNYCNVPFEDISLSAFRLLRSLVKHRIGQRKVAATGGFVEFLLDRRSSSTYEVKQTRFEVIEMLAQSDEFSATQISQFSKYVREGPNFVEPMSQVEFEPS